MTSKGNDNLYGIVLAGGKSSRMGTDKGLIEWHGREQRFHIADLLKKYCNDVFISCREDQKVAIENNGYKTITDIYEGLGPAGAILSAFNFNPGVAWLVVACDLPLLDEKIIAQLIAERDSYKVATAFRSPHDSLPEPLITIWETQSRNILISRLAEGRSCPRKALLNSDIKIIDAAEPNGLMNANTKEDAEKIKEILRKENERGVVKI